MATIAGKPIIAHDRVELDKAIQLQLEEAIREAQKEAPEPTTEVKKEIQFGSQLQRNLKVSFY